MTLAHHPIDNLTAYGHREIDEKPDRNLAAIVEALGPLHPYLQTAPHIENFVFERGEAPVIARADSLVIDLLVINLHDQKKEYVPTEYFCNSALARLRPVKYSNCMLVWERRGCMLHTNAGDLRCVWVGYTLESYLKAAEQDGVVEQVLILEWKDAGRRKTIQKTNQWKEGFEDRFVSLQKEGKVVDFERCCIDMKTGRFRARSGFCTIL